MTRQSPAAAHSKSIASAGSLPATSANKATGAATTDGALAQHAESIRAAGRRTIEDVVDVGRRLTEARRLCGHGSWLSWLDTEFGWKETTARSFIQLFEMSKSSANFANLDLPISSLYLLARPSTPDAVRQEVIGRAASGEEFSHAQVREAVAEAKPPKPKAKLPSYAPLDQDEPNQDADLIDQIEDLFRQLTRQGQARCAVRLRKIITGEG
jgi:hypothetical protein